MRRVLSQQVKSQLAAEGWLARNSSPGVVQWLYAYLGLHQFSVSAVTVTERIRGYSMLWRRSAPSGSAPRATRRPRSPNSPKRARGNAAASSRRAAMRSCPAARRPTPTSRVPVPKCSGLRRLPRPDDYPSRRLAIGAPDGGRFFAKPYDVEALSQAFQEMARADRR